MMAHERGMLTPPWPLVYYGEVINHLREHVEQTFNSSGPKRVYTIYQLLAGLHMLLCGVDRLGSDVMNRTYR